jgi:hypothetical protein
MGSTQGEGALETRPGLPRLPVGEWDHMIKAACRQCPGRWAGCDCPRDSGRRGWLLDHGERSPGTSFRFDAADHARERGRGAPGRIPGGSICRRRERHFVGRCCKRRLRLGRCGDRRRHRPRHRGAVGRDRACDSPPQACCPERELTYDGSPPRATPTTWRDRSTGLSSSRSERLGTPVRPQVRILVLGVDVWQAFRPAALPV